MTSVNAVHTALVEALQAGLPAVTVGKTKAQATPYIVVGFPVESRYRATHGSTGLWGSPEEPGLLFPVRVFVGMQLSSETVETIGEFVNDTGSKSIPVAVEADRDLGGVVDDCVVESFRDLGPDEVEFYGSHGAEVLVRVIARRG